ncbi:TetR family transcriptional regulator [Aliidiomarina minuta]|uniref:TetR family transcriptional regulator n=1 Tax=Aliidiomarina minuta TaxID=880057 RepID=A0A432W8Z1_9GAMM|nr:TetR/AcrR family transcriptional regulator [Aliidiomarina minuta]RUO26549.1 TetR family transcriptional regulator [Aliidiomarina minuta]
MAAANKPGYHHGDLRTSLLKAAESVLQDRGMEGFTLRECARRANVSHGAPAHHFGEVRGLMSALATESFMQLDNLMQHHRKEAPSDPFSQLQAAGLAYVEYASAHRARFQLMFRTDRLDKENERLQEAGERVYAHLDTTMRQVNEDAGGDEKLLADKTALAWSLVHGFATLLLENTDFAEQVHADPKGPGNMMKRILSLSGLALTATSPPEIIKK